MKEAVLTALGIQEDILTNELVLRNQVQQLIQ